MSSPLGPFLRRLRQSQGKSQSQAAQESGVGRVTLNRWESGKQQPRVTELKAVLLALGATPAQRRQATRFLGTREASAQERNQEKHVGAKTGIGPRPHGGSLLLALRLRSGFSQEEAARKAGVTTRTLRRWEKAESWPDNAQLHTLCFVLGAYPQEVEALTAGGTKLAMGDERAELTLEDVEERSRELHHYTNDQHLEALKDLGFLVLEAQTWPLAAHSASGRHLLSFIYSCHANRCSAYERWGEGMVYANRSLDLLPPGEQPEHFSIQAAIAAARCATYRGNRPTPERGMEILRHWLDADTHPVLQSWMLSDMAKYGALAGDASQNLTLARRAREAVEGTGYIYDLYLRELDEAELLVQSGEASQALHILERERTNVQDEHLIQFRLLEAQAWLDLRDTQRANERVRQAQHLIEQWGLSHFQPRAQKIIEQL